MTATDLVYFVGTAWGGDPEREHEFNEWYDTDHVPKLISISGILRADRYVKISGSRSAPPYLATYLFEDMQAYEDFQNNPLRKHLKYAGEQALGKGKFIALFHEFCQHIAGFNKDLSDDDAGDSERVMHLVATNCMDAGQDAEFNAWYNNNHVPMLLQFPGIIRTDRYRRLAGWGESHDAPGYFATYEFTDEQAYQGYVNSEILKEAEEDRQARWPDKKVFSLAWLANYRRMKTWWH